MPELYMIGGPNGAGKTTSAFSMLPKLLHCEEYINADAIAAALSPFQPEEYSIQAGRLMLKQLDLLSDQKKDFAFETTMASRSFVPFLKHCKTLGYTINLLFVYLENVELAKERVKLRVASGGHNIPIDIIERRYQRGLSNFFNLYLPLADDWRFYNNSVDKPALITDKEKIYDNELWNKLQSKYYENFIK